MSKPSEKAIVFSQKPWRYQINYGPDGETDYANVYDQLGMFVGNYKLHQAIHIVQSANTAEAIAEHQRVLEMAEKALQTALEDIAAWREFYDGADQGIGYGHSDMAVKAIAEAKAEIAKLRKE